jgi:hypothetical protein
MAGRQRPKKKRGPKGGIKHQPGGGHDRKSAPHKKSAYRRRVARKQAALEAEARRQWEIWDGLTEEQKELEWDLRPKLPRPPDR